MAAGWLLIEKIDADMSFGIGMKIDAKTGMVFGAQFGERWRKFPISNRRKNCC